ncbi:hypothetical protein ACFLQ5_00295 [Bacteroidota bacterium]
MKLNKIIILIIISLLTTSFNSVVIGQEMTNRNKVEQSIKETMQKKSNTIEVNVDKDLVTFVKSAFWIAGIFLAIVSFMGIAFFGFDVRNARKHLSDTKKELDEKSELLKELFDDVKNEKQTLEKNREDFELYVKQAQEKVEQLGAEIEGITNLKDETISGKAEKLTPSSDDSDNSELIKEIISNSSFEWTSLKRIISKTGLDRDKILQIARKDPNIEISIGNKSKDHIFKLNQ